MQPTRWSSAFEILRRRNQRCGEDLQALPQHYREARTFDRAGARRVEDAGPQERSADHRRFPDASSSRMNGAPGAGQGDPANA